MRIVYLEPDSPHIIGQQGENNAVALRVDITKWATDFPNGTGVILFTRPNKVVYPLETGVIVLDGKTYLQTIVTTKENNMPGWVVLQAQWYNGGTLVKSMLFSGKVLVSGDGTQVDPTETVPDWVAEWMNTLREAIEGASELIDAAETMNEDLAASQQAVSDSEAWARGTRSGEAVDPEDETYHNNSKYYSEQIAANAEDVEAWANGTRDGVDIDSDDPAYHKNGKYYNSLAAVSAASAAASASDAMSGTPEGYSNVVASISPNYDGTATYAIGDYCLNGGKLYRCTTAITEAEAEFVSAHWTQVNVGSEVGALKSAFDRADGQPEYIWTIGKTISSSGVISDGTNGAITEIVPVQAGDIFIRKSPGYDGDNVNLSMQLAYYKGETFDSRVSVAVATSRVIPADVTGIRVAFLHPSSSGAAMTQTIIDGYFDAILARKAVLDIDYVTDQATLISNIQAADNELAHDIEQVRAGLNPFNTEFVLGNIGSDGAITSNNKRAVTSDYLKLDFSTIVWCDSAYRAILCTYTDQYVKIDRIVNTGGTVLKIPANTYFKVCVYKNPEETITDVNAYANAVAYNSKMAMDISSLSETASYDFLRCFHKFCGIGDSLMAGFTQINGTTENSTKGVESGNNWFQYLMTRLNRDGTNLAIGSSTTHNWRYGSQDGYPSTNLSAADIDGVDCYFVGLGVNDMIHPSENTIGTSADIKTDYNQNADSTYGNLDFILHKLAEYNPYAKVFVFTVPWYGEYDPSLLNEAISYVCGKNANAFCIDLTEDNPISGNAFIQANFTGNHFNPLVYNLFSMIIEKRVNKYIYDNYSSFVWIPYKH